MVNYSRLNVANPVALAVDATGILWLAVLVKLGAIAGLTSVILVLLMGQPRIFFSMAHDGLLPAFFSKAHPRFGTPANTTIVTGLAVGILASLVPVGILAELVSIGTLAAFIVVCAGVLVSSLQKARPPSAFQGPLGAFYSCIGSRIVHVSSVKPSVGSLVETYKLAGIRVQHLFLLWNQT